MILMVMKMIKNSELFSVLNDELKELLEKTMYPYEILPLIHDYILELGSKLSDDYEKRGDNVWIHKKAIVSTSAEIIGPAIIMEGASIRHNAYLRENVIIGPFSIVGNSCEIKNSILLSHVEVPHFNYVGDSILGNKVHLGAGAILSNLRLDKKNIIMDKIDTNLRKIGAFIGDNTQIGCNSVICPGTIIYPNILIYPLKLVKGIVKEDYKEIKVERL